MKEIIKVDLLKEKYLKLAESFSYFYPIKVNDNPKVIQLLKELGSGFLLGDFKKAIVLIRKFGVSPNKILFISSFAKDNQLKALVNEGIRFFIIDSYSKINVLAETNESIDVLLRVSLSSNERLDRFGVNIDEIGDYINAIKSLNLNFAGLHFHIPIQYNSFKKEKETIKLLLGKHPEIKCLDVGGGFSFKNVKQLGDYIDSFDPTKKKICEIGYEFINDLIDIETKVIDLKIIDGEKVAFIDMGIYTGLIDVYIDDRKFDIVSFKHSDECFLYHVYGPSFDSLDYIGNYYLPKLRIGEKLLIKNSGAYVRTLLTNF